MTVGTCKVYLSADWVKSLKEKRSVVKGIVERTKNRFNVSIAEIEEMDNHKRLVIGFCCVSNNSRLADAIIHNVLNFIENITDARLDDYIVEIL
ncbi:MAG: DUF503 domain-containing protein [Clostridiales bacterium]|jgi:uncharacterized protein YlxP (DUF503 family)|nr:DUF503 domain-containing protein [Clostridiales bacterium]